VASFAEQRTKMVERQLRRRGIGDGRVLAAMERVPRELFVPEAIRSRAYVDAALPIGHAQTISQPWIVAATCDALGLRGEETVLEVGGGSGYTGAVLAELAAHVVSIELVPELAAAAEEALSAAGYPPPRVEVIVGDGSLGLPDRAPFDAIAVHAASPGPPSALLDQLSPGGRLVAPVAAERGESLTLFWRDRSRPERYMRREIAPCRFVPLLGAEGYPRS
jgi:protein-L-isoaspartate(D-aspartate) O-methyltransferase